MEVSYHLKIKGATFLQLITHLDNFTKIGIDSPLSQQKTSFFCKDDFHESNQYNVFEITGYDVQHNRITEKAGYVKFYKNKPEEEIEFEIEISINKNPNESSNGGRFMNKYMESLSEKFYIVNPEVLPVIKIVDIEKEYKLLTQKPEPTIKQDNPPYLIIPDKYNNRKIAQLWFEGKSAEKIGKAVNRTTATILNVISKLRSVYGEQVIPYHEKLVRDGKKIK